MKLSMLLLAVAACTGNTGPAGPQGAMGAMGSAGTMGSDGQLRIYGDGSQNDLMVNASGSLDALVTDGNWQFHDVTIAANETLT
ncbi:MAG TPA: collagen-like protein, partial [Kofleriaceae bacterium]|nr:collagen-like protein [Kofleriaceae bacterium]